MATKSPIDPELVRELAQLLNETDLTEIEVEKGDLRVRVARTITADRAGSGRAAPRRRCGRARRRRRAEASLPAAAHPGAVPSPMVGTAYRRALARGQALRRDRLGGEGRRPRCCWSRR